MIKQMFVDKDVLDYPLTRSIRSKIAVPCRVVESSAEVFRSVQSHSDPIAGGKQALYLTRNLGAFIKKCPGTKAYRCCGYEILHIGNFCIMDCSYCILQTFFHPPVLTFYVNVDDLMSELDDRLSGRSIHRFGTGEFTDSLIWEGWTDLSETLVNRFARQSSAVIEFKTKTAGVERFGHYQHNRKTIMSWSLNTPQIIAAEEKGTATLEARLAAASRCEKWGYPISFHFDPIILYEGWQGDYRQVVDLLFERVSPDNVVWISLGTLRFMPALKLVIETRHPASRIAYGEFISGLDGKYRYFKPLRIDAYQRMISWIRDKAPDTLLYLCMEDDQTWAQTMGIRFRNDMGINDLLNKQAIERCGLSQP